VIRVAVPGDLTRILELLKDFAQASLIKYSIWTVEDETAAKSKLLTLIRSHYLIVAVHNDEIVGMIGAQKEADTWLCNRKRIRELFWWVTPAFRRSRISAELFIRWEKDVTRWLKDGLADQVSLSTQPGLSDIDLSKRGWQCVEAHWIKD